MNTINYAALGMAQDLYDAKFARIEVPWWASVDIVNVTKPPQADSYALSIYGKSKQKALLASGEQGFLYLANKGQLPLGKYQTVTPCFRDEPYDRYHSKQFMKLELIRLMPSQYDITQWQVVGMASFAQRVFGAVARAIARDTNFNPKLKIIETGVSDPIQVDGTRQLDVVMVLPDKREIELGSYGARRTSFATWIYGTGLAEPRFSRTLHEAMNP